MLQQTGCCLKRRAMIKTTSHSQEEIIASILKLHSANGCIDLDPTYSKGVFYKGSIKEPRYCFDIEPKFPHVGQACATKLPLPDNHVDTIMFDPPFLATQGPSLKESTNGNIINSRFGVYPTEKLLHDFCSMMKRFDHSEVKYTK